MVKNFTFISNFICYSTIYNDFFEEIGKLKLEILEEIFIDSQSFYFIL